MNSDALEENSFYELRYARSPNSTIRKSFNEDYSLEIREKNRQIEDLTYEVKLQAANN